MREQKKYRKLKIFKNSIGSLGMNVVALDKTSSCAKNRADTTVIRLLRNTHIHSSLSELFLHGSLDPRHDKPQLFGARHHGHHDFRLGVKPSL